MSVKCTSPIFYMLYLNFIFLMVNIFLTIKLLVTLLMVEVAFFLFAFHFRTMCEWAVFDTNINNYSFSEKEDSTGRYHYKC